MASMDTANARTVAFPTVKVTGALPLTDSLVLKVQSGELASMDTDTVEAYLLESSSCAFSTPRAIIPTTALVAS